MTEFEFKQLKKCSVYGCINLYDRHWKSCDLRWTSLKKNKIIDPKHLTPCSDSIGSKASPIHWASTSWHPRLVWRRYPFSRSKTWRENSCWLSETENALSVIETSIKWEEKNTSAYFSWIALQNIYRVLHLLKCIKRRSNLSLIIFFIYIKINIIAAYQHYFFT